MDMLIYWVSKIPDVIWSAVIASLLTFLGVLWTNKGNEKRQIALLKHEEKKYKLEQAVSLKKDVFLAVAGSFAMVLDIIPKLMNLDFSDKDIGEELGGHSAIVAKTYLSAEENTVSEILMYSSDVAEAYLGLLKPRAILLDHKKAIEIYQQTIDQANAEKNRIVSMMKELNLQGRCDENTFDFLNKSYETQEKIIKVNYTAQAEQEEILKGLYKEFCENCISIHGKLLLKLPPMTIAIRRELDNDKDSKIFEEAISESVKRMKKSFEQLLG